METLLWSSAGLFFLLSLGLTVFASSRLAWFEGLCFSLALLCGLLLGLDWKYLLAGALALLDASQIRRKEKQP